MLPYIQMHLCLIALRRHLHLANEPKVLFFEFIGLGALSHALMTRDL